MKEISDIGQKDGWLYKDFESAITVVLINFIDLLGIEYAIMNSKLWRENIKIIL